MTECSKLQYKTQPLKKSYKNSFSLIFVDTEVKNNPHSNTTTAKQCLSIISKLSGQFFISNQDTVTQTRYTRQSTFLPVILSSIYQF